MLYIILAVALAIDILFIRYKFKKQGFFSAFIDGLILVTINAVMGGSLGGEIIGTLAALFISIYLWFYPPVLSLSFKRKKVGYR